MSEYAPNFDGIQSARKTIERFAHRTPVMTNQTIDGITGARLFFKCENFQRVGAFKFRGATNAVQRLSAGVVARGVATHSSGNHAQALALAARMRGAPAYIVMPSNSPQVKKDAVAGYGAEIIYCEPTLVARETTLAEVQSRTGAAFVHPYNNPYVICGQGSAAAELIEETGQLDIVMAPVGGGGLLSGTSIATRALLPNAICYGAEPAGADDARRSLKTGELVPSVNPKTIADGLLTSLGELTFKIITENVADIFTAGESSILTAMRLIWERMKIIVEPSSAVPLAAMLENPDPFRGRRVGIILSGGNVDLNRKFWS
ncbi:MAG: pyridoxal-phosphate dependent enzyme [Chloroflexota bacterium]